MKFDLATAMRILRQVLEAAEKMAVKPNVKLIIAMVSSILSQLFPEQATYAADADVELGVEAERVCDEIVASNKES